jgi:predicted dehydrogenase
MLSFWHVHAKGYARQATELPDTEIVAIWDEVKERGKSQAEERGVRFYETFEELLGQPDIDGVIVSAPSNMHRDLIVAAAKAGKHIFTEKVLALTLKECNEILAAVKKAGVKLTVSLPRLNDKYTQAIMQILDQSLLGDLTLVRTRLSHDGAVRDSLPAHFYSMEQCGGGALIDLGCHPMYLANLFLGLPESVTAHFGYITGKEVEDNAIAVLKYPNGAFGIVEAGFVNPFSPFNIEIHGTAGSLLFGTQDNKLLLRSSNQGVESSKQWNVQELPEKLPSAFQQWVSHIQENTTAVENIKLAVDLTKLMEAANLSAKNNRAVCLEELSR